MNLWELHRGDMVRTNDNNLAEILAPTEDGRWIRVRYLGNSESGENEGTEDLCHENELAELIQHPHGRSSK